MIAIVAIGLSIIALTCASGDDLSAGASCPAPDLRLAGVQSYWSNYADYRVGLLSVDLTVANSGSGDALGVAVTGSRNNNGVRMTAALPGPVAGSLGQGAQADITLKYLVPAGITVFNTVISAEAEDSCGNLRGFQLTWSDTGGDGGGPVPGGCRIFPADNYWNVPVDDLPLDPGSDVYIQTIGSGENLHPDFGSGTWDGGPIGIPYVEVGAGQATVAVSFDYDDESDPGPYPIPADAPIEGGSGSDGDRHVLIIDRDSCKLYELFYAWPQPDGSWQAGSGAIFDLGSNGLRPASWTSADAAGLPIYPGLVRYDEVVAGEISHAIRFTAPETRAVYVWPARHFASELSGPAYPPMGQRFRLKADFDVSGYSSDMLVILTAMKRYGIVLADNGSPWMISGVPDERWDNDELNQLKQLRGADFEAVDTSSLMLDPDSARTSR